MTSRYTGPSIAANATLWDQQTGGPVSDGDLQTVCRRGRPRQVDADVDPYRNLGDFGNRVISVIVDTFKDGNGFDQFS